MLILAIITLWLYIIHVHLVVPKMTNIIIMAE
jgi:hypothetical protein